jgi:hypothetical protein
MILEGVLHEMQSDGLENRNRALFRFKDRFRRGKPVRVRRPRGYIIVEDGYVRFTVCLGWDRCVCKGQTRGRHYCMALPVYGSTYQVILSQVQNNRLFHVRVLQ